MAFHPSFYFTISLEHLGTIVAHGLIASRVEVKPVVGVFRSIWWTIAAGFRISVDR